MKLTAAVSSFMNARRTEYAEFGSMVNVLRDFAIGHLFGAHTATVVASGAIQEVGGLPFDDTFVVIIVNVTTAELTVHLKGMGAGTALEVAAAAVFAAANGITLNSGVSDAAIIDKLGSLVLGTAIGANGDQLRLFAFGR